MVRAGAVATLDLKTLKVRFLARREPLRSRWRIGKDELDKDADQDREYPLEVIEPAPGRLACDTIHVVDAVC